MLRPRLIALVGPTAAGKTATALALASARVVFLGANTPPDDVARAVLYAVSQPAHLTVHELRLSPS